MDYRVHIDTRKSFIDNYYYATVTAYNKKNEIFINANVAPAFLMIEYNRKWMFSLPRGSKVKAKDGILVVDRWVPETEDDLMLLQYYNNGLYLYTKGLILRSVLVDIGKSLGKSEGEVQDDIEIEFFIRHKKKVLDK